MQALDLSLLVTLDALLQEGSVTRAARRVGLSTPAMSHALARIRTQLGDPLLVRAGRTMVLTPHAENLRAKVHDLVAQAQSLLTAQRPFSANLLERSFTIHATDHILAVLGLAVDHLVARQAPGVALRFLPNTADDAAALREGAADLTIGIYGELPPELRTRQLLTDRFVCVVRQGHPQVSKRLSLDLFLSLEHVQIAPRGRPGGYLDDRLGERGLSRRVARAVPYFLAGLLLVAESDYILTISERIAAAMVPRLGLRIFEPPLELQPYALSLLWHPRMDGDPAHRWLREIFVQAAREVAGNSHTGARTRL